MKKLSDYQGEEALELWAELIEPMFAIIGDPQVSSLWRQKGTPIYKIASAILKSHKSEASKILLAIDDTPLNAINAFPRTIGIVLEFINNSEARSFFGLPEQEKTQSESSGSATENTEESEQ